MNLIHFQGLNCYQNCIITVAAFGGVDYCSSLATLWSETEFIYDPLNGVYSTKRMLSNLEKLGAMTENLNCSSTEKAEESLSSFQPEEWIVIGMDAFYIPWNQYYQKLHSTHYFIAQKEKEALLCCFDPTYNQKYMYITPIEVVSHAFDILRVQKVPKKSMETSVMQEAQEVIAIHPKLKQGLLSDIKSCICQNQHALSLLAKYINALIQNRYIYRHYLQNKTFILAQDITYFHHNFFLQWTAVKNGLFKASIINNNECVVNEVCAQFIDLMDAEIAMAEKIITLALD